MTTDPFQLAAEAIRSADALFIGAGAGMGVDSGLPDFRGNEGFWNAYPPFRGKRFAEISNPRWFRLDPAQAWGFFGHRLSLYRGTTPHAGFATLRKWGESRPQGYFVFTSNVDGHFQAAGFNEQHIVECHGSIHFLQCAARCTGEIWPTGETQVDVDAETIRARGELPTCPRCGNLARPNILMFGDYDWLDHRTAQQESRLRRWFFDRRSLRIAVLEFGAGSGVPTVRITCEEIAGQLIRINPRDTETPLGGISLPCGAKEAIERIDALL